MLELFIVNDNVIFDTSALCKMHYLLRLLNY